MFLVGFPVSLNGRLERPDGFLRPTGAGHLELLPTLFVVLDKELLYLREQCLADVVDRFQVLMAVGVDRDRQQPVIRFGFPFLRLLRGDDPNDANFNETPYVGGRRPSGPLRRRGRHPLRGSTG